MDCAVVALADRILGELVSAVVQIKPSFLDKGINAQTLIDHCKKILPSFKVPVFILFVGCLRGSVSSWLLTIAGLI
jgi:acyl-CoA synthetase (AMP-forming)/AMP-acid ligase II